MRQNDVDMRVCAVTRSLPRGRERSFFEEGPIKFALLRKGDSLFKKVSKKESMQDTEKHICAFPDFHEDEVARSVFEFPLKP